MLETRQACPHHVVMWHTFSSNHVQRGDVTAVVWGAPGTRPPLPTNKPGDEAEDRWWMVDAEELTRGRRAETPFVQQCDLIFPLADRGRRSGQSRADGIGSEHQREVGGEEEGQAEVGRALAAPVVIALLYPTLTFEVQSLKI